MENLDQIVDWAAIGAVIVALGALVYQIKGQRNQLKEDKKGRSAQIANDYLVKLLSDTFVTVSRTIGVSNRKKLPLTINATVKTDIVNQTMSELDLTAYLTELEALSLFINDDVISEKYAYEIFSDMIFGVLQNDTVKDYLEENKKIQSDFHEQLYKANEKLLKYKREKS